MDVDHNREMESEWMRKISRRYVNRRLQNTQIAQRARDQRIFHPFRMNKQQVNAERERVDGTIDHSLSPCMCTVYPTCRIFNFKIKVLLETS